MAQELAMYLSPKLTEKEKQQIEDELANAKEQTNNTTLGEETDNGKKGKMDASDEDEDQHGDDNKDSGEFEDKFSMDSDEMNVKYENLD